MYKKTPLWRQAEGVLNVTLWLTCRIVWQWTRHTASVSGVGPVDMMSHAEAVKFSMHTQLLVSLQVCN